MKFVVFLAVLAFAAARPDAYEKLGSINVEEFKSNTRLLANLAHCLTGDGKCTKETNDIKTIVPEAVQTTCEKCNPQQKKVIAQIIQAIIEQLPAEWDTLSKKYDPEGARKEDLDKFLAENA